MSGPSGSAFIPSIRIEPFYDPATGTVSYVIWDDATRGAAVIDPVLDFDLKAGRTATTMADRIIAYVQDHALEVEWVLETHAHADHLSAAHYLRRQLGGKVAIGEHIRQVQEIFCNLYNLERSFKPDGSQFDHLFQDGEDFRIGCLPAKAWLVPGHTPADMAYVVAGCAFVGDTLFMPRAGTARADFPGGDAHTLYRSIRRLLEMPPETRIFVCHDYPPVGVEPAWESTVAEQRAGNIHVRDGITEDQFVGMRTARDATLDVPTLLLPSLQVNVRGGRLPPPDDNGVAYLRIPLNALPTVRR